MTMPSFQSLISSVAPTLPGDTSTYNRAATVNSAVPSYVPTQYKDAIFTDAQKSGLPPSLVPSLINNAEDKNWNPNPAPTPGSSATGMTQMTKASRSEVMPQWQATHPGVTFDPSNPYHAISAASMYLGNMKTKYGLNDPDQIIMAYNVGAPNLKWASTPGGTPAEQKQKQSVLSAAKTYLQNVRQQSLVKSPVQLAST